MFFNKNGRSIDFLNFYNENIFVYEEQLEKYYFFMVVT